MWRTNKIHEEFGMSLDSLGSFNDRQQYSTIYLMYKNVLPLLQNCILGGNDVGAEEVDRYKSHWVNSLIVCAQ